MKKKKLLSILLSAALAFSLTACGNSNNEAQTSNSASSSTSTPTTASKDASSSDADASTDTAEADPFGKYADPLEIHFVRATDDTIETNVLANLPGQTLEDNFWLDTYEDELGIKIVYDWIVKGDDEFNQKMNVSMASEELPDVMCVTATQMMQLIDAGLVQEMGPVFEQYATDFTKEVMNQEGDSPFLAGQKDGVQYGLPVTGGSVDSVDLMWIRTDWLEKLNLEVPTTMDEVLTMVDQFVNADFDGNGAKDTVGIGVAGTSMLGGGFGGLRGFFNAYGAYPGCPLSGNAFAFRSKPGGDRRISVRPHGLSGGRKRETTRSGYAGILHSGDRKINFLRSAALLLKSEYLLNQKPAF